MTAQPAPEIRSLQMLRALAAVLVVVRHSPVVLSITAHNYWIDGDSAFRAANYFFLSNHLELGVDIFFVISGFIMAMLLDRSDQGPVAAERYLVARAARIFPPYWFFTLIVVVLFVASRGHWNIGFLTPDAAGLRRIFDSLSLLPMDGQPVLGVGWTLIIEFQFYLLCGLLIMFGWQRHLLAALGVVCVLALVLEETGVSVGHGYVASVSHLEFLAGALAWRHRQALLRLPAWLTLPLAGLLFAALSWYLDAIALQVVPRLVGLRELVGAAMGCALIAGIDRLERDHRLSAMAGGRWAMRVGNASYSVYLAHYFVLAAMARVGGLFVNAPPSALLVLHAAAVWLAVWLPMHFAERVELPLYRRISAALSGRRALVTAKA